MWEGSFQPKSGAPVHSRGGLKFEVIGITRLQSHWLHTATDGPPPPTDLQLRKGSGFGLCAARFQTTNLTFHTGEPCDPRTAGVGDGSSSSQLRVHQTHLVPWHPTILLGVRACQGSGGWGWYIEDKRSGDSS